MATVDQPASPSAGAASPSAGAPPSAPPEPSGSGSTADAVWPDLEGVSREGKEDEDDYQQRQDWQHPGHRDAEAKIAKDNEDWWRRGQDWSWQDTGSRTSTSTDAKGYLPKVPGYDGDRQKNPKGFQIYKRKVEGFVVIAKAVIPEEQIGVRLYYEVTGKAFEYLEGTDANQFAGKDGWRI